MHIARNRIGLRGIDHARTAEHAGGLDERPIDRIRLQRLKRTG